MATLLRRVWCSVLARAAAAAPDPAAGSPRGRYAPPIEYHGALSLGALDALPTDVLAQILRLLRPFEAARSCTVCRAWRVLASDNGLWAFFLRLGPEPWDLVVFAETHLAAGPASHPWLCYDSTPQLSFKQIYGLREVVPGSVIVDGGSGYCKYGWSKYAAPSGRCATFLEFGNIESPMYARLRHFFQTIYTRMQVKAANQPIIVVLPLCHSDDTESARASRKQYEETLYSVLFDMNVPAVCAVDQAVLALYASKRTSGIVVHIGFNVTSIVPTADYEAELRKDTHASCEIDGEGWFTLSEERFKTTEILFQPHMGGMRAMGLHKALSLCMDHCYNSEVVGDDSWYKTVVLAGGSACFPGLPERLEKELHQLLPSYISEGIRVLPPAFGTDSAWFGAKMIGNVSTFTEAWCVKKKQFRQKIWGFPINPAYGHLYSTGI